MLESITVFKLHILIPHSDAALNKNLPACVAQLLKVQLLWGTDSGCSESVLEEDGGDLGGRVCSEGSGP